jgi:hypothetical protein
VHLGSLLPFVAAGDAVEDRFAPLQQLSPYNFQLKCSHRGQEVVETFQDNPLRSGVIFTEQGKFVGMISRRRFLEQMSNAIQREAKRPNDLVAP